MHPIRYKSDAMPRDFPQYHRPMNLNIDHSETQALVTGGTQGLGYAISESLIACGCRKLVITGRDVEKGGRAASKLRDQGADVHFIAADMGNVDAAIQMVNDAVSKLGYVNALVNVAASTARGSILETTADDYETIMNVNAKGPFFAIQTFAKHCIQRDHPGNIVNILSVAVHCGPVCLAGYTASKCALLGISKNAANALKQYRIRVNSINVGWMDTPGEHEIQVSVHGRPPNWLQEVEKMQPFGSLIKPKHVANQVALFLSPASGIVTGAVLDWDQHVIGAYA